MISAEQTRAPARTAAYPASLRQAAPTRLRTAAAGSRAAGLPVRIARLLRTAQRALDKRCPNHAERTLLLAQRRYGHHPEFLRLLGLTRQLQKRHDEALAAFRRALAIEPADPLLLTNAGNALHAAGEQATAESMLRRACLLAPGLAAAWYHLGRLLHADGRTAEAAEAHAQALRCEPAHLHARIAQGDCLRMLGRSADAATAYRVALKTAPRRVRVWGKLANLKTVRLHADEADALARLQADPTLSANERVTIGFARVKALEDQERYAEACAALLAVNAAKRRQVQWDAPGFSRRAAAVAAAFADAAATDAPAQLGREVIFVVSMPRSGSTLTEQILSSHAQVEGAGELTVLADVLNEESRRRGLAFPSWVPRARADDWRRLGETYLEHTASWRRTCARFTDKALANWLYVGAARAMLPGARFIDVRRDPLETCLSCFRQCFQRGHPYAYDLRELARFRHDYERLSRLWRTRHPRHVLDFVYEDLVAAPEPAIRRLLAFCDLPFDAACLRFHENQRSVRTLSSAQVREPLRETARAHRYETLLQQLRQALREAGVGLDDERRRITDS